MKQPRASSAGLNSGVGHIAGRVINREQQSEARSPVVQPSVMAAVYLQQHPFQRHPRPPHAVLGRTPPAGAGHSGRLKDAADREAAQVEPLVLPQQFAQMGVVGAWVTLGGKVDHDGGHPGRHGVLRPPAAIAMDQRRRSTRAVGRQQPPHVALAQAQHLSRLRRSQVPRVHTLQHVTSRPRPTASLSVSSHLRVQD